MKHTYECDFFSASSGYISLMFALLTTKETRFQVQVHLVRTWPGGGIRNIWDSDEQNQTQTESILHYTHRLAKTNKFLFKTICAFCLFVFYRLVCTLQSGLKAECHAAWLLLIYGTAAGVWETEQSCLSEHIGERDQLSVPYLGHLHRLWLQGHGQVGACISYFNLSPAEKRSCPIRLHVSSRLCLHISVCVPAWTRQPTLRLYLSAELYLAGACSNRVQLGTVCSFSNISYFR